MTNMTNHSLASIQRALISVSDKTGIVEFASQLTQAGVEILSTGGTYKLLKDNNVNVVEVSEYTGFPEMMDGRVKTLHPKVHGGILARRGTDDAVMQANAIDAIDLVVVNLYPFESTVANPDCSLADAVENIDIGGPTMVRAAAKNHNDVTIVVNSSDYQRVLNELAENDGATTYQTRFDLAIKAYEHTAAYDGAIANYFGQKVDGGSEGFPRTFNTQFIKTQSLRYGENPHQQSAFYVEKNPADVDVIEWVDCRYVQWTLATHNAFAASYDAFMQLAAGFGHDIPENEDDNEQHVTNADAIEKAEEALSLADDASRMHGQFIRHSGPRGSPLDLMDCLGSAIGYISQRELFGHRGTCRGDTGVHQMPLPCVRDGPPPDLKEKQAKQQRKAELHEVAIYGKTYCNLLELLNTDWDLPSKLRVTAGHGNQPNSSLEHNRQPALRSLLDTHLKGWPIDRQLEDFRKQLLQAGAIPSDFRVIWTCVAPGN